MDRYYKILPMLQWNFEKHPFCLKKFIEKESKSHQMGQAWTLHSWTKIQVGRREMGTGPCWVRKFSLQLIKEKPQTANFFYQLIVVFVRTYQINVQFSKIEFFLGIVTFWPIFLLSPIKAGLQTLDTTYKHKTS